MSCSLLTGFSGLLRKVAAWYHQPFLFAGDPLELNGLNQVRTGR